MGYFSTSNPVLPATSGQGGFDSHTLPPCTIHYMARHYTSPPCFAIARLRDGERLSVIGLVVKINKSEVIVARVVRSLSEE